MEKRSDAWDAEDPSQETETERPLIGMVTSFNGTRGDINQSILFQSSGVCEGTDTQKKCDHF